MYYDKKIRYFDYLENGQKLRCAGFVKIEIMDESCNIQVNVTGLHPTENCTREVRLMGSRRESAADTAQAREGILGDMELRAGRGSLIKKRLSAKNLCEGISYDDLAAIRISLGKSRELLCRFREEMQSLQVEPAYAEPTQTEPAPAKPACAEPSQIELTQTEPTRAVMDQAEELSVEPIHGGPACPEPPLPELSHLQPIESQQWESGICEVQDQMLFAGAEKEMPRPAVLESGSRTLHLPLHEKKWRQLSEIYPHIAPFRDERDYLSIGPGDFVILPQKYYRLISNSFLLHGFYNYGHMVLARTVKKGEETYYVGVPGNFYEKERQVAIMFGFESFECRQEPARDGDFGYFMIRVEI